jgi:hypothetical protein
MCLLSCVCMGGANERTNEETNQLRAKLRIVHGQPKKLVKRVHLSGCVSAEATITMTRERERKCTLDSLRLMNNMCLLLVISCVSYSRERATLRLDARVGYL